jgi:hypothetical protein
MPPVNPSLLGTIVITAVITTVLGTLATGILTQILHAKERKSQKRSLARLLYYEAESHRGFCKHVAEQKSKTFVYYKLRTDAYEKAYFAWWYLLPEDLITPIAWHYSLVYQLNSSDVLGNSTAERDNLFSPDKEYFQGMVESTDELLAKLKKLF